jgi:DNA polymerase-3 subunit gamma/tau
MRDDLKQLADQWGLQTVLAVVGLIDEALTRIRHSLHGRVLLEAAVIQICHLPDLQAMADLAAVAAPPRPAAQAGAKPSTAAAGPPPPKGRGLEEKKKAPLVATAIERAPVATAPPVAAAAPPVTQAATPQPNAATPQPSAATRPEAANWDPGRVQAIWGEALGRLESMTETLARAVERVEAGSDGQFQLWFPGDAALTISRLELPEHRSPLLEALSDVAGRPVTLQIQRLPVTQSRPDKDKPAANRPSRMQRMREIEAKPLVKSCVDLFDAEIVRVDRPG